HPQSLQRQQPDARQQRRIDEQSHQPQQPNHQTNPKPRHPRKLKPERIGDPNPNHDPKQFSTRSPKSGSLSTIVRSYKSAVTRHARRLGFQFEWQSRFHDHILRDAESFERITEYIKNNPKNWKKDKFYNGL